MSIFHQYKLSAQNVKFLNFRMYTRFINRKEYYCKVLGKIKVN